MDPKSLGMTYLLFIANGRRVRSPSISPQPRQEEAAQEEKELRERLARTGWTGDPGVWGKACRLGSPQIFRPQLCLLLLWWWWCHKFFFPEKRSPLLPPGSADRMCIGQYPLTAVARNQRRAWLADVWLAQGEGDPQFPRLWLKMDTPKSHVYQHVVQQFWVSFLDKTKSLGCWISALKYVECLKYPKMDP